MPVKREVPNADDLVERYLAGASIQTLRKLTGCSRRTVCDTLSGRGVVLRTANEKWLTWFKGQDPAKRAANIAKQAATIRGRPGPRQHPPLSDDTIRRYLAGESCLALARDVGMARTAFVQRLSEQGVAVRGRSEGSYIRMGRLTADERKALARAAHDAVRGRKVPDDEKARRALAWQVTRHKTGLYEADLAIHLIDAGLPVTHQRAIGGYNVDVAIDEPPVAIEVQCSNHRKPHSSIQRERLEYILDRGWHVLAMFVVWGQTIPDIGRIADQAIAFAKVARLDPSGRGQYGMIDRNGEAYTPPRFDLPRRPRVEGF